MKYLILSLLFVSFTANAKFIKTEYVQCKWVKPFKFDKPSKRKMLPHYSCITVYTDYYINTDKIITMVSMARGQEINGKMKYNIPFCSVTLPERTIYVVDECDKFIETKPFVLDVTD